MHNANAEMVRNAFFIVLFPGTIESACVARARVMRGDMSYAHADTCTDKHMQSAGQFADWAFEKARTALCDGLGRQVSAEVGAAARLLPKQVFTPGWGMR